MKDFFPEAPAQITEVWIFKDQRSYESYSRAFFNTVPTTPYGFYLESRRALLMKIAAGDGTLVHELVHPFVHQNLPDCPAWFNEGLASLYERPGEEGGHLRGYPNWRLPGLKEAISRKRLVSLKELVSMNASQLYEDDDGTHYAQARNLCYYLQEKGLLAEFFARFRHSHRKDPTGEVTLRKLLGLERLTDLDGPFREFAMGLCYR